MRRKAQIIAAALSMLTSAAMAGERHPVRPLPLRPNHVSSEASATATGGGATSTTEGDHYDGSLGVTFAEGDMAALPAVSAGAIEVPQQAWGVKWPLGGYQEAGPVRCLLPVSIAASVFATYAGLGEQWHGEAVRASVALNVEAAKAITACAAE